jgi:hypothetical protein
MRRSFLRDETGMTMALTVIMILLIGVMGAGLLAFVQSDLKSVIEVNQGQKALDIAEAGVQAAKSHLRVDSFRRQTTVPKDHVWGVIIGRRQLPSGPPQTALAPVARSLGPMSLAHRGVRTSELVNPLVVGGFM